MSDQTTTQESATTTQDAAPEMWVPDEPTPSDAMARPEADDASETPDETAEAEAGGETEEKATETVEQPKPQQQWNVPLQKMAQRQTTFEREVKQQIASLGDEIKGVLNEIKSQGGRATPQQQQQLQDAKDDLTELFNEAEKADIIEGPMFAKFMRAVLSKQGGSVDAETKQTLAAIQQKLEATERLTAQQAEQQQATQQWEAIKKANPDIDAEALKRKAWEGIDDRYPDFDEAQKRAIAAERFDLMLAAEKAKPKPAPKIDPASTTPPKSTKGTQTVPPGASTGRPATSGAKPKPPLWEPD